MNHVQDMIQAYIDGELPAGEAARVEDHCRSCDVCGRALREAEALWRLVDDAAPARPERSFWPEIVRRGSRPEPAQGRLSGNWTFAGAALAATIAGVALGMWVGGRGDVGVEKDLRSLMEEGTVFVESTDTTTLDQIYLAMSYEDGGDGS